jgi:alpha-L-rhamnosidase
MFSDASAFFYKALAGINPDESAPGFLHTNLKPNPVPGLDHAEGWHESPYGVVRCGWRKTAGGLTLDIEVPQGTTATLMLPAEYRTAAVNGGVAVELMNGLKLEAGAYEIVS